MLFRRNFLLIYFLILIPFRNANEAEVFEEQCQSDSKGKCENASNTNAKIYDEASNQLYRRIENAVRTYKPCAVEERDNSVCKCYVDVISNDLDPYKKNGITKSMIDNAAKYGTRYKILNKRLYRDADCAFPARCLGIEHFLLKLLPQLDDVDLVINTRDYPQLPTYHSAKGPVFSFSKTIEYRDIMYPAWAFWAGGPAISLHPTGIGRWDLLRESISKAAAKTPWIEKQSIGFFRGSRTSDERDSLILLSRHKPALIDAKYTKNQAWKSPKDTLNAEPAAEVSFEDHCRYKYLFNFRGVAASFRLKHLFLCKSLVFHVGNDWNEFFYFSLKPWVHYVPLKSYPTEDEIEALLTFFQNNDSLAQDIAKRGYDFIWDHLKLEEIECYWATLLKRYKKLLKYGIKADKELIEIKTKYSN